MEEEEEDKAQKQEFTWKKTFGWLLSTLDREKGTCYYSMKASIEYHTEIIFRLSENYPDKVEKVWWVKNKEMGESQRKSALLTPGKFLSALKKGYGDKDPLDTRHVEYLTHLMEQNIVTTPRTVFDIVQGPEISYWYDENHYKNDENLGQLAGSCMRNKEKSTFEIYSENPNQVKMLILRTDEEDSEERKLLGRALLWYGAKDRKGQDLPPLMDRIYASEVNTHKFIKFAENNHFMHRRTQSVRFTSFVDPNELREKVVTVKIKLDKTDFSKYPLLDSLKYLDNETCELSTEEPSGLGKILDCANGSWSSINGTTCNVCGHLITEIETHLGLDDEPYCADCFYQEVIRPDRRKD